MLRTYSRKLQVCRYIADATSLCRLCLERAEAGVPIFGDNPDSAFSSLALRVMICVGLEVKNDACLPNLICLACCKELEQYYAFRKKCEVSYQKLKLHLQAARIREAMETVNLDNNVKDVDANIINQSVNQDEKVNISDLRLIGEDQSNCNNKMEFQAPPGISDMRTQKTSEKAKTETVEYEVLKNPCPMMEPGQLSSVIASVLVKLGVLGQQDGLLARLTGTSHIQLETRDGVVVDMQLEEEEDAAGAPRSREGRDSSPAEPPAAPAPREPTVKGPGHKSVYPPWACAQCGRALSSATALRRHALTHSGERPHACPDCGRRFAQPEVMRRHRLVHAEVRPHKCSKCPKSFTQRNALALHERSHLPPDERPLALHGCPHCPKMFLYASGLSRHLSAHSGRVFACGACGRRFADRCSARRHVRRAKHARAGAVGADAAGADTAGAGDAAGADTAGAGAERAPP